MVRIKKLKKTEKIKICMSIVDRELLDELARVMGTKDVTDTITKLVVDRAFACKIIPIDETAYAPTPPSFESQTRPTLRKDIKTSFAPTMSAYYGVFKSGVGAYRAVVIDADGNRSVKHCNNKSDAGVAYDEMAAEVWGVGNFTPNNPLMRDPLYFDKFEVAKEAQGIIAFQQLVRETREKFIKQGLTVTHDLTQEHVYNQVDEFHVKGTWPEWLIARRDRGLDLDLRKIPADAPIIYTNWTRSTRRLRMHTHTKPTQSYPTRFDEQAGYRVPGVDDEAEAAPDPNAAKYTDDGFFIPRRVPLGLPGATGPKLVPSPLSPNPLVPNPLAPKDKK